MMDDPRSDPVQQNYEDWTRSEFRERFPSTGTRSALTSRSLTDLPEKYDPLYRSPHHPAYNKPTTRPSRNGYGRQASAGTTSTVIEETDNTDPRRSLTNILTRFADRTSCIGPPYINSSNHFYSKFFWSVVFLGMIVATIINVYNNFETYYEWPVKTTVAIGYSPLTFPTVTVCNTNAVKKSGLVLGSDELQEFVNIQNPERYEYQDPPTLGPGPGPTSTGGQGPNGNQSPNGNGNEGPGGNGGPPGRRRRFVDQNQRERAGSQRFGPPRPDINDQDGEEVDPRFEAAEELKYLIGLENATTRYAMGHQLDTMLLSCSFEGRSCEVGNFSTFLTDDFGLCYSFNQFELSPRTVPKPRRSFRHGNVYGFQLMLFLDVDEYVPGVTLGYGARLSVSYPTTMAFPSTDGLFLSAGVETDIGVKMVNISRLPTPYFSHCTDNQQFTKDFGFTYTRGACQSTCPHRHILENCHCYESSKVRLYPRNTRRAFPACNTTEDFACIATVNNAVLVEGTMRCNCPNPCNETTYDLLISSREWPEQNYLKALIDSVCRKAGQDVNCRKLRDKTPTEQRRNFLKLNVFYRDLNYETLTEEPDYPDSQFLSDLGGSVGLWIGLSVMSLVEVVELVGEILVWMCRKCKRGCRNTDKKHDRAENGGHSEPPSSQGSSGRGYSQPRNGTLYRPSADS